MKKKIQMWIDKDEWDAEQAFRKERHKEVLGEEGKLKILNLIKNSTDVEREFIDIVDENFWDLI